MAARLAGAKGAARGRGGFTLFEVVVVTAMICVLLMVLLPSLAETGQRGVQREIDNGRLTIEKAIRQCYALEGEYPLSLEYVERYYGLDLNRDRFDYAYERYPNSYILTIAVRRD
ncbi:MAG: type II secretion system GspH family protein [Oscillospiraceae bacterium]|nr:type II secretion system GspH family protein [Oscillospiraceae bacterium]